jgi:hypothetical protein
VDRVLGILFFGIANLSSQGIKFAKQGVKAFGAESRDRSANAVTLGCRRPKGWWWRLSGLPLKALRQIGFNRVCFRAAVYRLRFKTPDPLSLINCTVWLAPCTTI